MDLRVHFAGVDFKNPIVLASGTSGYGEEFDEIIGLENIGGISTKGLTIGGKKGNPGQRIYETASGVLNSVGLENIGIERYIQEKAPLFDKKDTVHIVNLGGNSEEDYLKGIDLLNPVGNIDIVELNISCPNVKEGGLAYGIQTETARTIVRKIRERTDHKLMVKCSPNCEDIISMAQMIEEEKADAISLVNTFLGMAIDVNKRKPIFENIYAGLSGPAIKPIALRMVHQVAQNTEIPIMGIGGIASGRDVLEYLMAGATVVQIGAANFTNPRISLEIIKELEEFMKEEKIENLSEIIGIV